MKTKNSKSVRYRVYDKHGRYHHSYVEYVHAKACAKHIGGKVTDIENDKFNPSKDK
jgi:hypothetical protein